MPSADNAGDFRKQAFTKPANSSGKRKKTTSNPDPDSYRDYRDRTAAAGAPLGRMLKKYSVIVKVIIKVRIFVPY